jgi:hypothetical protein
MTRGKDGFLEGNGIIILILFFLMFGGGFGGFGGFNNAAAQGALTRAELYDGLDTKEIQSSIRALQSGLCDGFYAVNTTMLNGFNGIQRDLCQGFSGVTAGINQLGYQMQSCCCDLKTAIHAEGEETRALIQANLVQNLRDTIADKDRELLATGLVAALGVQTQNIQDYFKKSCNNGCGCGCGW